MADQPTQHADDVRCSHCSGSGKVWSRHQQQDGSYRARCSICDGSGWRHSDGCPAGPVTGAQPPDAPVTAGEAPGPAGDLNDGQDVLQMPCVCGAPKASEPHDHAAEIRTTASSGSDG